MASSDLFDLIHSLKQTEKRYFKRFAQLHVKGEQNNYVRLFDAIEAQEEFDEAALLDQFAGEAFTRQFSVTKNYLFNIILKCLRSYHAGHDVEAKIFEIIQSSKILYDKGLYKKGLKLLNKAKQMAHKCEKFALLLTILAWEDIILYRHISKAEKVNAYKATLEEEFDEVLKVIENKHTYRRLKNQIYTLYRRSTSIRSQKDLDAYHSVMDDKLLKNEGHALSMDALMNFYQINGIFSSVVQNYEEAKRCDQLVVEILESNKTYLEDRLSSYISMLNNLLDSQLEFGEIQPFFESLQKMRNLPKEYPHKIKMTDKAMIFETTYSLEISYYLSKMNLENGLKIIPEIENGLEAYEELILPDFKTEILYNVSKTLFYSGQLRKALNWVSRIVFEEKSSPADDFLCFGRLLNVLIHFDLKHFNLLQYEIKSTRRFIKQKNRLYSLEKTLLSHLNKIANSSDKSTYQTQLEKCLNQLLPILEQPYGKSSRSYLNITAWLKSKIENKSILEFLEKEKLPQQ